ncbi:fluoride efflux transporter FluC [Demequina sediminicola]|uniref:fluoride efflux transporter FluC n=1 Tax=Demequina sediminicola TaxID=1095026 RepID=UPI00078447C9|nr:CrcB family protein [Demequina sediminicola]
MALRAQVIRHPIVLVFLGGTIGGAARIAIDVWVGGSGSLPWDLLAINVIGSLVLGAVTGWALVMGRRWWLPLVGPGMLGGFTTFSSIAALSYTAELSALWAGVTLAVTMVAAVLAAALGWRWGVKRADAVEARL